MVHSITLLIFIFFLASLWRDNRSILNPILLILFLTFGYFSLATFTYQHDWTYFHIALLGTGFILLPLAILLSGIFLIYNGIVILKKEGKSKVNFLSLAMGITIVGFFGILFLRISKAEYFYHFQWLNIPFIFFVFSFFVFGFAFTGFLLYSILYLFFPKKKSYDFIIIHGAGLMDGMHVTPLLKKRIDKAVEAYYRLNDPDIKIIASGGKGSDEKISEAQAIANYLKQHTSLTEDNIVLEDKSVSTYQNLLFSKQIGEQMKKAPRFLFVTNDYHVFRTSLYAKKIKINGDGLGCQTARYYVPSAFIREFIAVVVQLKWLFLVIYALFLFLLIIAYLPI